MPSGATSVKCEIILGMLVQGQRHLALKEVQLDTWQCIFPPQPFFRAIEITPTSLVSPVVTILIIFEDYTIKSLKYSQLLTFVIYWIHMSTVRCPVIQLNRSFAIHFQIRYYLNRVLGTLGTLMSNMLGLIIYLYQNET